MQGLLALLFALGHAATHGQASTLVPASSLPATSADDDLQKFFVLLLIGAGTDISGPKVNGHQNGHRWDAHQGPKQGSVWYSVLTLSLIANAALLWSFTLPEERNAKTSSKAAKAATVNGSHLNGSHLNGSHLNGSHVNGSHVNAANNGIARCNGPQAVSARDGSLYNPMELNPIDANDTTQIERLRQLLTPEYGDRASYQLALRCVRSDDKSRPPEEVMRDILEWRAQIGADDLLPGTSPGARVLKEIREHRLWPSHVYGRSKFGHLIIAESANPLRKGWPALSKRYELRDIIAHRIHWYEQIDKICQEAAKERGQPVLRMLYILDIGTVGFDDCTSANMAILKSAVLGLPGYYPCICCKVCIVNANAAFTVTWKLVSKLLDETSIEKTAILGRGSSLLPAFRDMGVELDQLPEFLGGTCKPTRDLNAS